MSTDISIRLTPTKRLTRGLVQTAAGPVDIARGTLGLVGQSVAATAGGLATQVRKSKARKELRKELSVAGDLVSREFADVKDAVQALPQTLADTREGRRGPRPARLLLAAAAVAVLAGGAVFAKTRRTRQPEASTLPPSVPVEPRP